MKRPSTKPLNFIGNTKRYLDRCRQAIIGLLLTNKSHSESIQSLRERLNSKPNDLRLLRCLASNQYEAADYEAVLDTSNRILKLNSQDGNALFWRGTANYQEGNFDEAILDFSEALTITPKNSSLLHWRGQTYLNANENELALLDLSKSLELGNKSASCWMAHGRCLKRIDDYDLAILDFDQAILAADRERSFDIAMEAHQEKGRCLEAQGHAELADSEFEKAAEIANNKIGENYMTTKQNNIYQILKGHFQNADLESLVITQRKFPIRVRPDFQAAMESMLKTVEVSGCYSVRQRHSYDGVLFAELLVRDRDQPIYIAPLEYEEFDIGEDVPTRCLKRGIWIFEYNGKPFAALMNIVSNHLESKIIFQMACLNQPACLESTETLFQCIERTVQEAKTLRGKILSLKVANDYSGQSSGVKVHRLKHVPREQVILPTKTLELLDRNVIGFCRSRARLAAMGLATKKGLLFYGPPGTGKTHTLHYLAAAIEGLTTLIITAEQVGFLGEYMTLARLLQPCMVVIEDADLIAREREQMGSACEEVLLNKLLNEMDGLRENADILFVLTTNRPKALEAALKSRPGRIDQAIEFPFPNEAGREKLVQLYSGNMVVDQELVELIVSRTDRVSASFIKELMRRSAQFQIERSDSEHLNRSDVENALHELVVGGGSLNRELLGCEWNVES